MSINFSSFTVKDILKYLLLHDVSIYFEYYIIHFGR